VTTAASDGKDAGERQVFRSPAALAIWWLWALFALANLIDLVVQGRDHASLVAAFILLLVTGIVYITALRPRIVADADALTIVNPVRAHRVDWAAVAGADPTDLLRVRCEWPAGDKTARQAIYSWAVHSPRRRQVAAELRARRQSRSGSRGGFGAGGGFGSASLGWGGAFGTAAEPSPEGDPLRVDPSRVIAALTARAEQARLDAPGTVAAAPVATWDLIAVAAVVLPGLALLITVLA
jgi:uncharacterized membrane protein YgcG